ncbi:DUF2291 family protein [Aurantibacter crassamenti]|uniref:DUF2291 family protein n=1 Tax=Aurantibacter crassamenti TaxID=1837375 RepID=UPI00193941EE|nr:DUF2291 family protein [Aurantibacter crassamenti]MBM1105861.1 DUF2291 family protein [Aurantibacter crassamenti]
MNKAIKYVVSIIIIGLALYNSVYFKPLDEVKKTQSEGVFDAALYAKDFVENKISSVEAFNAGTLLDELKIDLNKTTSEKGKKLGISNDYYFTVEGEAIVLAIEAENVVVKIKDGSEDEMNIATDFIFGNTIREATVAAEIGDYQNTMDFNNISVELNNSIRDNIIPPFVSKVKAGDEIYFKGAVKVNVKSPSIEKLRIVPLVLNIKQ